ncbi:MAG: glycoside hydrolase family 32 protein [Anaerolineaceae bacterium]|nr:glycoside hydrolase family 32 protein [Anaerolineaceae bacterium]
MSDREKLRAAEAALRAGEARAAQDPQRPAYHFLPPANWINDPNGTIHYGGEYHLFYQLNPYKDDWGPMHWGHARSKDLVYWEHLPVALAPSHEKGEHGVWSGCARINRLGQPMIFYTSANLPNEEDKGHNFSQWCAIGDDEMLNWNKLEGNPLLSIESHGTPEFSKEWRDPFIFEAEGRTFMTIGMCGVGMPIYEAVDDAFLDWRYRGLMHDGNPECPNFFEIDGKWCLLTSPYEQVRYAIGDFDAENYRFTPEIEGVFDHGDPNHSLYYATNHCYAPDGRSIIFGWIRGWKPGRGWNGCHALPRKLRIAADGTPRQLPVKEVKKLRGDKTRPADLRLDDERRVLDFEYGDQFEMKLRLRANSAAKFGLRLRADEGPESGVMLYLDADGLHLDQLLIPLDDRDRAEPVRLRFFVDRSVIELFVNDGKHVASRVFERLPEGKRIELFAEGGAACFEKIKIWHMRPIW